MSVKYDFDTIISRYGTNCLKYDSTARFGMPQDILPLWVADMDFRTSSAIVERLKRSAEYGIFGYPDAGEEYDRAVTDWFLRRFSWKAKPEWIIKTPGVVFALSVCIRAYTDPGDAVMIQEPVYYPFRLKIEQNGRRVVNSPLVYRDGVYEMDFEDLEKKFACEHVKMMILCSPHNPVSRVWDEASLRRLARLCLDHGVILVSDEIHCDFTWENHRHIPVLALSKEFEENTVVCTAPSKTFNLAGLCCSNIFIPDEKLRQVFQKEMDRQGAGLINTMGLIACQAAYEEGEEWLDQAKAYIWDNLLFMEGFIRDNLPEVTMIHPQGTYLAWVDFRKTGLEEAGLHDLIVNKAGLWLDEGEMFGKEGTGFQRFNAACPRAVLEKAMVQLEHAFRNR